MLADSLRFKSISELENKSASSSPTEDLMVRQFMFGQMRQEAAELRSLEADYSLNILQYNQELIEEIQKVMGELAHQNESMLIRHLQKRSLANQSFASGVPVSAAISQYQTLQTLAATSQLLQSAMNSPAPTSPHLSFVTNLPSPFGSRMNGGQQAILKNFAKTQLPTGRNFMVPTSPGSTPSPSSPPLRCVSPPSELHSSKPNWTDSGEGGEKRGAENNSESRLTWGYVGYQLVALIEELREVAEDKELNQKSAEERLIRTLECLRMIKELLNITELMSLDRLQSIARDPDTLQEKERDTYYYSVLMTYLNIAPNKHGMKPEHLLWSQEKVRHYIEETRISHIWKEICPLKEWIFHKSLEKKQGKRMKKSTDSSPSRPEKRTQYQNWPAVVFPLLLKDHFLSKIRKHHPGLPEPGVVNNTVLAHRRLKRDQERFRKQAKI